jgi:hypothetical protein
MTIGVVGMEFFPIAGELRSTGASPVVRRALAANLMACVRAAGECLLCQN